MINTEVTTTKGVEQAQRAVEQAKNRLANEKKKAHAERRKQENAHKYMMGVCPSAFFFIGSAPKDSRSLIMSASRRAFMAMWRIVSFVWSGVV